MTERAHRPVGPWPCAAGRSRTPEPRRSSEPAATGSSPIGIAPRSGRVESRCGRLWKKIDDELPVNYELRVDLCDSTCGCKTRWYGWGWRIGLFANLSYSFIVGRGSQYSPIGRGAGNHSLVQELLGSECPCNKKQSHVFSLKGRT